MRMSGAIWTGRAPGYRSRSRAAEQSTSSWGCGPDSQPTEIRIPFDRLGSAAMLKMVSRHRPARLTGCTENSETNPDVSPSSPSCTSKSDRHDCSLGMRGDRQHAPVSGMVTGTTPCFTSLRERNSYNRDLTHTFRTVDGVACSEQRARRRTEQVTRRSPFDTALALRVGGSDSD